MHWTALLERRFFPPDAVVIDDLPCVGCGYNLRSLPAAGSCPECGGAVGESLYVLRRAPVVASAVRTIGFSYLGSLGMLVVAAGFMLVSIGLVWIGVGVLVAARVFRVAGTAELRHRGALENLPVIGRRLALLWWLSLAELIIALVTAVLLYASRFNVPGSAGRAEPAGVAILLWMLTAAAVAVVAGSLGSALAAVLGYALIEREFQIQRVLVLAGPAAAALFGLTALALASIFSAPSAAWAVAIVAVGVLAVTWALAAGFSLVGLLHLGAAAERERELREEAVSGGRTLTALETLPTRPRAQELPDIPLEESEE